jgi:hypothetical protein
MELVIIIAIRITTLAGIMTLGEILAGKFLFPWIKTFFNKNNREQELAQPFETKADKADVKRALFMGIAERVVLLAGLALGIQAIFTVFGALKIATRFKGQEDNKIRNEYFLAGNFASILLVLIYHSLSFLIAGWCIFIFSRLTGSHLNMPDSFWDF